MQEQAPSSLLADQKEQRFPLAITSLVLGFLSCTVFGILSGIPAVICGHISLSKLKDDPERYSKSKRLAVAGLFLGYTGIVMTILLAVGILMLHFDWGPFEILTTK